MFLCEHEGSRWWATVSSGALCGFESTQLISFMCFLWFIFNNQQYCISKTFFLSSQTLSLSALLHPPPANPVRNAGDVDFPVCVLPPRYVEEHTCRAPEVMGLDYTHTHTHFWDIHDWAPITCCSLCLFSLPALWKTEEYPSSPLARTFKLMQRPSKAADIFPACLFSLSIPIFFLPFFEATQGATNEKAISNCSLYKGLCKQASKYREAFQLEEKIQKGAGETGERKMDR